ncbi:MAG: hypothetical protein PWR02_1902 [Synergistales bacterium]|jgi:hypothetical protein|nr:hypothetical protein [Synergistales bacterium]
MKGFPVAVGRDHIPSLLEKSLSSKDYSIKSIEPLAVPVYIIVTDVSIKRAFGLKPRQFERRYVVDGITEEVFRIVEKPEYEEYCVQNVRELPARLSESRAAEMAEKLTHKNVARSFKFFWYPEIAIRSVEKTCLLVWLVGLQGPDGAESTVWVNSFSGMVKTPAPVR